MGGLRAHSCRVLTFNCVFLVRLKCTKFDFGWVSASDPAGGSYSFTAHSALPLPIPLAGFKGPIGLLLTGNREGRERVAGKGKGGKERGKGREKGKLVNQRKLGTLKPPMPKYTSI